MSQLRAYLIDDEPVCTQVLQIELNAYCPEVEIVGIFNAPNEAILALQKDQPDVLFLDVEMGVMTGFDLLNKVRQLNFDVVFVTAYDSYAVKAFDYCAVDYLLKPVMKHRLIEAVEKLKKRKAGSTLLASPTPPPLQLLQAGWHAISHQLPTIPIPTSEGLEFIRTDEIVYIEADGNYSTIYMKTGREKYYVTKSLKELDALLSGRNFLRTHHSFIVNPIYIKKYVRGNAGYLVMSNGASVDISRANKEKVIEALGG